MGPLPAAPGPGSPVPRSTAAEAALPSDACRPGVAGRVAASFGGARVAAEGVAVPPQPLPGVAVAVSELFADPSRVPAGEAHVFAGSSRRAPGAAGLAFATSFPVV